MKVAIVHYWLVGMRGGEKVVEALCRLYPQADIFTHVYVPENVSPIIRSHRVVTSFIASLPGAARMYKSYFPLMPMALEQLDLRGYDLIISSESGPAKGVVPPADALHLCYCHSPMRYIWNMYHDYRETANMLTRIAMSPLSHYIRMWDAVSANRVHHFVANSHTVKRRLHSYYRREADVIHPPVDTKAFAPVPKGDLDDYYLIAGELVPYKRVDIAIEAFRTLKHKRLIVVGGGQCLKALKASAPSNVSMVGPQPFAELRRLYAHCRALLFPGEEDFGIVPVEAMASGRPVVAFAKGGATETVVDGVTGLFFHQQSADALIAAIEQSDRMDLDVGEIRRHAERFDGSFFLERMQAYINARLDDWSPGAPLQPSQSAKNTEIERV